MNEEEFYRIVIDKFTFRVRKEYLYSSKDSWMKIEKGTAEVGISDLLQTTLGDIVFVELLEVGTNLRQFDEMSQLESIKAVISIISPVSGVIVEINHELEDTPELINKDPYGSGWIAKIKTNNIQEDLKHLLDADSYFELMKKKIKEKQKSLKQGAG